MAQLHEYASTHRPAPILWLLAFAIFCLPEVPTGIGAASDRSPALRTITTQDRSGAVILWDATPYVERFIQQGTPAQDALKALEANAVGLFVRNAVPLASSQRHLRIIVSYVQTGATEARYQTKTFEGVKRILTVEGKISPRLRFPEHWQSALQRGMLPPGLKVEVAHDLPTNAR